MEAFAGACARGALAFCTTLILANNQIGDVGMQAFSTAVAGGALAQLQTLWLSDNQIGDAGLSSLSEALASGALPSLYELSIGARGAPVNAQLDAACRSHRPYIRLQ